MRKSLIPIILIVSFFWQGCTEPNKTGTAIGAIPINAPLIVEVHSISKALQQLNQSAVIIPFLNSDGSKDFQELLKEAGAAVQTDQGKFKGKFYAFANVTGATNYAWAMIISKETLGEFANFTMAMVKNEKSYSDATIFELQKNEKTIYACDYKGVLAFSFNENLIEEIIRQIESGVSLENDAAFLDHHKIANSSDPVSVYLNLTHLPEFAKTLLSSSKPDWIGQLGSWMELDTYTDEEGLFFNGAIINGDSTNYYTNCFKNAGTVKMQAAEIIPSNATVAVFFGTENFLSYARDYQDFLRKKNLFRNYQKGLSNIDINLEKDFYPYVSNEFGIVYTEPKSNVARNKMAYIKVKKPETSFKQFVTFADDVVENYRENPIYQIKKEKLLPLAMGRAFKGLNKPYFILRGEWLIFANDIVVLKSAINDYIAGKTWNESISFQAVKSQFDTKANLWVFLKNPAAYKLATFFMDENQIKAIEKNKEAVSTADWLSIQIKNKGEANLVNGILSKQPKIALEASQVWALELDAPVSGTPQFIYNHNTKKRDILVQDQNNQLYWINAAGDILWKKLLESRMLGKAVQIDLFKNNKLQLAFTTTDKFYVVDRLGRDVTPFPISPLGKITAPLAVFDYDNTRNYRFLVCSGKEVVNYNGEGNVVTGWEFTKAHSTISTLPKHYTLGGRDYIVVGENDGTVNILNRKGQQRISIDKKFVFSGNIYLEAGQSKAESKLMSINKQGYLKYLYLNNTIESVDLGFSADPKQFVFDGKRLAFTGGDYFFVKDQNYPFNRDGENEITSLPGIFTVNNNIYYTYTTADQKVFVLNREGQTLQGFPVYGSSNAVVGSFTNSGKPFVVAGSPDGSLYLYRLTE